MDLREVISGIRPADPRAAQAAQKRWDSLAKPLGSLGLLETAVIRMAGIRGREEVTLENRTLVVFCADNGVVRKGVSQSDQKVTAAVARALGEGTSTVSYMARDARCQVRPVDIGMAPHEPMAGLEDLAARLGTADITEGPAMSRQECLQALEAGLLIAREEKQRGTDILLTGEMGIGNTTTSCAVACVLLGKKPEELAGRGAGLSDAGLERKISAIRQALSRNNPDGADPMDVLGKVGGLDLAGLCGLCLGGAYYRIPVLLDGMIAAAAALCAVRLCPAALDALLASHLSGEPAAKLLLDALSLEAPLRAGMHLGEGTGAVTALKLLDAALCVYNSGHTFSRLGIEAYQKQGGGRTKETARSEE